MLFVPIFSTTTFGEGPSSSPFERRLSTCCVRSPPQAKRAVR